MVNTLIVAMEQSKSQQTMVAILAMAFNDNRAFAGVCAVRVKER